MKKNLLNYAALLAFLLFAAGQAHAAFVVSSNENERMDDGYDGDKYTSNGYGSSGGYDNFGGYRNFGGYNGSGGYENVVEYHDVYSSPAEYAYHTEGNPAAYRGAPYQNYRGYSNGNGYGNSSGYYGTGGYLGGYSY